MKEKSKSYFIKYFLIIFVVYIVLFGINKYFKSKTLNSPLPEVKLKEKIEKEKTFAIMISEDGNNYQKYESNEWPNDKYRFKEAKCIDNKGNLVDNAVSFESSTKTVILETDKTVVCTLYFDHKETIEILRENDNNKVLSTDKIGGMYRYQGVGVETAVDETHKLVDNNYICFGTASKESCIKEEDKYMYRIIGITKEGQLYLIKMKAIEEGDNKTFQWWNKYVENIEWPQSSLYKRLNGTASNGNPIFINNSNYEYMKEENDWYKKIENHKWLYGDVADISNEVIENETVYGVQNNGLILYDIETGKKFTKILDSENKNVKYQWSADKSVDAKIGLMYIHDYYLAYDNERNWQNDYDTSNWIYFKNNNNSTGISSEWLISRIGNWSGDAYADWRVIWTGQVTYYNLDNVVSVRPTFYLIPTIKIINGSGKINDPYILN